MFFDFVVRLVGGGSHTEGLVEVYYSGSWGTVCHNDWDDRLATMVCAQLGLSSSGSSADFAPGVGSISISNIICSGNETVLADCGHYGVGIIVNCDHSKDVGVKCHGINFWCIWLMYIMPSNIFRHSSNYTNDYANHYRDVWINHIIFTVSINIFAQLQYVFITGHPTQLLM